MSRPSDRALSEAVTEVRRDRRGRVRAWRRGRPVPVPADVRALLAAAHPIDDLWTRLECFGGGTRACPWNLRGAEPQSPNIDRTEPQG